MNNKLTWFMALVLVALVFPLSNVLLPKKTRTLVIDDIGDELSQKVSKTMEAKCMDCHSSKTKFPFYAKLPVAKQLIEHDIKEALGELDFETDLKPNSPGFEQALAKLEHVTLNGNMPPFKYTAMHWDSVLSEDEKDDFIEWIERSRTNYYSKKSPEINPSKVKLGELLYHDKRLSGDNSVSCASCHDLGKGGTDQARFSTGIHGQVGDINSPTTLNSVFNIRQFWDGRASDLAEQAGGPVNNPIEMGSNWQQVIAKLKKDPHYRSEFSIIYNGIISGQTITDAIAEFEKSLLTSNSKFDKYLEGDDSALNADEKAGYKLFKQIGCAQCHFGNNLGGRSFEKMGLKKNYFKDRKKLFAKNISKGGYGDLLEVHKRDYGLFNFTGKEEDRFKFKVPSLRNIADTFPYFHDGSTEDLSQAISIMAEYQLGKKLSAREIEEIKAFLLSLQGSL